MIENLIEKREMARKNKDFVQADSIRDQLTTLSVVLEDGPSGVTWKIKR
jgi:cysteinyl-tRNA synthetase